MSRANPNPERELVGTGRVSGELIEWKGHYGWIRPKYPIEHPQNRYRGGRIYLSKEDLDGEPPQPNTSLSFLVYVDKSGLGAMECRLDRGPAKPAGVAQKIIQMQPQPKVKARIPTGAAEVKARIPTGAVDQHSRSSTSGRSRLVPSRVKGILTTWDGYQGSVELENPVQHPHFAWGCREVGLQNEDVVPLGDILLPGTQVTCFVFSDARGRLGAEAVIPVKGDSGGGSATPGAVPAARVTAPGAAPVAPAAAAPAWQQKRQHTPWSKQEEGEQEWQWRPRKRWKETTPNDNDPGKRERITAIPVLGKIVSWKGKIGWIKPEQPVEHPMASKNSKDIYLHVDDVQSGLSEVPAKGTAVNFHIYVDNTGLGAEECILL